jgi:hypothetical protein
MSRANKSERAEGTLFFHFTRFLTLDVDWPPMIYNCQWQVEVRCAPRAYMETGFREQIIIATRFFPIRADEETCALRAAKPSQPILQLDKNKQKNT